MDFYLPGLGFFGRDVDYKLERSISEDYIISLNINSIGLMLWFYDQISVNYL
jgi:hypothetical protein